ncbi:MAG: acyltransferase [Bdellovibrionales bacterium]|nr:acyltransferase [Bdellovibrionales bacterium]
MIEVGFVLSLSHPSYRADIDGLRAIAVLAVVVFHTFPAWLPGGFVGVDVFFVISGFLISTILFSSLENNSFSFFEFYSRRIRRIFPALAIVLIFCLLAGWWVALPGEYQQLAKHTIAGTAFVANFVFWQETGYFDNSGDTKPLLHLWSLGIEEQFYIVWPLLLWVGWRFKVRPVFVTVGLGVTSFLFNLHGIKTDVGATFYSPHTRIWELLMGGFVAWLGLDPRWSAMPERLTPKVRQLWQNSSSVIGMSLILYSTLQYSRFSKYPGTLALLPTFGTALIIAGGGPSWLGRYLLSNRVLVWFGLISYPLYLWHWPLISFTRFFGTEAPGPFVKAGLVLLATLLAWITYRFIERPLRKGVVTSKVTGLLILTLVSVALIGVIIFRAGGFVNRFAFNVSLDEQAIERERTRYLTSRPTRGFEGKRVKVLFYGDSHAADLYKSFSNDPEIGLNVLGMGHHCVALGAGAELGFESFAPQCADSLKYLLSSRELSEANVFVYGSFWRRDLESSAAEAAYERTWAEIRRVNPTIKIVVFGPKPVLGIEWRTINSIVRGQTSKARLNSYLNEVKAFREHDNQYAKAIASKFGLAYVDVSEIYCRGGCVFYSDNKFAYFDNNHWTEFGAKVFFDKFRQTEEYQNLFQ